MAEIDGFCVSSGASVKEFETLIPDGNHEEVRKSQIGKGLKGNA
jgi:hypothetical protein